MNKETCRWGILGSAGIARKNWQAIRRSGNGIVVAVASRDSNRAAQWIAENQGEQAFDRVPDAVGGYDSLLAREDVDAVYIPLPTGLRGEWVKKAAAAGKHVLCEKPCGVDAEELAELIEACRAAGVQFMDGVMFMHSDRMPAMRKVLDDGESVGEIRRIATQFSFLAPDEFVRNDIRYRSETEPLGCLGDLGWYNIRIILWAMNCEMPVAVTGRMISQSEGPDPVPTEFSGELVFAGGATAGFYCSFRTENQQWVNISGTRGNLRVSDFVLPHFGNELSFQVSNPNFVIEGCEFRMEGHDRRHIVVEHGNSHTTSQETRMFRKFADLVISGELDDHWPGIALKTQQVLNACLDSARSGGGQVSLKS